MQSCIGWKLKFSEVYAVNIEVNGLKNLLKNE